MFQGIVTGNNSSYLLSHEQIKQAKIEKQLLHPILLGRDFEKWFIRNEERQIMYINANTDLNSYPNAKLWLLPYKKVLEKRRECVRGLIPWYALQWARDQKQLDYVPKILVQRTRNPRLKTRIVATLDTKGFYGMESIIFIIPKNQVVPIKYLLAILNSSLINYLYQTKFLNVAVKAEYLKNTPIPLPTPEQQNTLVSLVDHILTTRQNDQSADVSIQEAKINDLVFDLYGLSEEEKTIIVESTK